MTFYIKLFVVITLLWRHGDSARILGIFPVCGSSHFNMHRSIMLGLAKKGHEVDVVSHFPLKEKVERYTDLSVAGSIPIWTSNVTIDQVQEIQSNMDEMVFVARTLGHELCDTLFQTDVFKKLRDEAPKRNYDLLIVHSYASDCFLVISHLYGNIPVIAVTTNVNMPWHTDQYGDEDNPSYVPIHLSEYGTKMTFWQRLQNAFWLNTLKIYYNFHVPEKANEVMRKYAGDNIPDIENLSRNVSLLFTNSHFSFTMARPVPPSVIEIGGVHIPPPEDLRDETILDIINSAKKGVVLFTFGSMIRIDTLREETVKAIFKAFSAFEDFTFIVKGNVENYSKFSQLIPKNVKIIKWIPQLSLLCHPKTKLFVTHGGIFSIQEGIYCSVPLIGIPIFADQKLNVESCVDLGIAEKLNYRMLTVESLKEKLDLLLNNNKYLERVKEVSRIYRDRPMSAMETTIYWVEYVINHKGPQFLKPYSTKLTWYQRNLIDVVGFILVVSLIVVVVVYKLIRALVKLIFKRIICKAKKE